MIGRLLERAGQVVLPWWARWAALAVLALACYGMGCLHEARRGADALADYKAKQAAHIVVVVKREVQVVTQVETKYRDRIQVIYKEGKQIEERIPEVLTPDVDRQYPLPVGLVRMLDAAWAGTAPGPASDSDRGPSDVPASVVAENEADNATSCRAWREQALGWREFYAWQQVAINGKAGEWANGIGSAVPE